MSSRFSSTRREFLRRSASLSLTAGLFAAGCSAAPAVSARRVAANEKLAIGIIGAGGRGFDNLQAVAGENIVALADVDDERARSAYEKFPQATRYRDFRQMLDREKSLDAVVVSTPDHTHAVAAIAAMRRGLHVYCEKPLAHSIHEARRMAAVAREMGVVTQMGTQGHAMEGSRRAVEIIRSGAIGDVTALHVWTDRPAGWWPQGEPRPSETPAVPATLDWDLWLGPAAARPFHPVYVPFKWRGRWDFGTGAIGDMGVHNLDTAYWALELGLPTYAEVKESAPATDDCPPLWSRIEIGFPARGEKPPVTLTFYDGKKLPPAELFLGETPPGNGSLAIGTKGTLFTRTWHGGVTDDDMYLLLPRKEFAGFERPAPSLPRTEEHHLEWIQAAKGGPRAQSDFGYAARLTESLLVGLLASRTGRRIEWDAERAKARGFAEADRFIRPEFRKGWEL